MERKMKGDKDLQVTSPAPRDVWRTLLQSDIRAIISQTPEWIDCLCKTEPYLDATRLYETARGRKIIVPMVRRKGLPQALAAEASLPHGWGIGGLIAEGGARPEDIHAVMADLADRPVLRTTVRPDPLGADLWEASVPPDFMKIPHLTHVLDLAGGFENVWTERFSSKTRTKIRRAERSGLVVECGTGGNPVSVFYDLYIRWLDQRARQRRIPITLARWLGRRREPLRKFESVAQAFGDACRIWIARLDGQPVAASVLLIFGVNAVYWRNASDKESAGSTRANDLLQRLMIEDACDAGCRYYHMGESGGVASLMHFKSRFGAIPYRSFEYYRERLPFRNVADWVRELGNRIEEKLRFDPGQAKV
jgi:hypothetical protein